MKQSKDWDVVIMQLTFVYIEHTLLNWCKPITEIWLYCSNLVFTLSILYWTGANQWLRCGYIAATFCLHWAYCIELLQSSDWNVVILQLPCVYIEHTVLNWCKAVTEMWLYCSNLVFTLSKLYWTDANQWLRCGYTAANLCLHWVYCIELVQTLT